MITGESLVRKVLQGKHPEFVVKSLIREVAKLLNEGQPEFILEAAVAEWELLPETGPNLFPYLVSNVVRRELAKDRARKDREKALKQWEAQLKKELKN